MFRRRTQNSNACESSYENVRSVFSPTRNTSPCPFCYEPGLVENSGVELDLDNNAKQAQLNGAVTSGTQKNTRIICAKEQLSGREKPEILS
jgi:hypothetical protein